MRHDMVSHVRRTLTAVVLSTLIAFAAAAQVSEVIEVRVIEVEVVVVNAQGQPVRGLTKADFELREGGKQRDITNFYAVDHGQLLRESEPEAGKGTTAPEPPVPAPPTHFVFFVDNDHLELKQRNRILAALRKFVEANVKPGMDASLVTYNHEAKVRVPFTADPARIIAEIDVMENESARLLEQSSERRALIRRIDQNSPLVPPPHAEDPDQLWQAVMTFSESQGRSVENSLLAVSDAIKRFRGVPGRKVLVHVSSGLPLQPGLELMDYWRQTFQADPGTVNMAGLQVEKSGSFKRMIADANTAGITVDTIDAGGLTGSETSIETEGNTNARLDFALMRDNRRGPLQLIAAETGGRSIINENDFDRALLQIGADTTTYYSLGFRGEGKEGLRNVEVHVKQPGLTVHTAKAHSDRTAEERIRDTVESAFDFPFDANPLGVTLAVGAPHEDAGAFAVPLTVRVAPSKIVALPEAEGKIAHIRCYYEVRDSGGGSSALRVVDQNLTIEDVEKPRLLTRVSGMRLRRGKYTLSLAVRDLSTNETSYVQAPIEIP
jgi:VWFA-related protein